MPFCRLIVTDAQSSELHARLEAAEENISASQEAARVAHQRKVEAEEKAAHLEEQIKELQAKAKHSVSLNAVHLHPFFSPGSPLIGRLILLICQPFRKLSIHLTEDL